MNIYIMSLLLIIGLVSYLVLIVKILNLVKDFGKLIDGYKFQVTPNEDFIGLKKGTLYKATFIDDKFHISAEDSGKYSYILSPDKLNVVGLA